MIRHNIRYNAFYFNLILVIFHLRFYVYYNNIVTVEESNQQKICFKVFIDGLA